MLGVEFPGVVGKAGGHLLGRDPRRLGEQRCGHGGGVAAAVEVARCGCHEEQSCHTHKYRYRHKMDRSRGE